LHAESGKLGTPKRKMVSEEWGDESRAKNFVWAAAGGGKYWLKTESRLVFVA